MFETIIRDKSNHWVLSNCLRSFYFYTYSPILTSLRQTLQKLIEMVEFGVKDGCFYHGHSIVGSMISNKLKLKTSGTIQCFFFNQSGSFSNNVDQQKCRVDKSWPKKKNKMKEENRKLRDEWASQKFD